MTELAFRLFSAQTFPPQIIKGALEHNRLHCKMFAFIRLMDDWVGNYPGVFQFDTIMLCDLNF